MWALITVKRGELLRVRVIGVKLYKRHSGHSSGHECTGGEIGIVSLSELGNDVGVEWCFGRNHVV